MNENAGRWLNVLLGVWLFISTFIRRHSPAQHTNTWIMGLVTAAIALGGPAARYLNTAGAVWIVISAFVLPAISVAARWNNFLVGIAIGVVSLTSVSSGASPLGGRPHPV